MIRNRIPYFLERMGFDLASRPSPVLMKRLGITAWKWGKWVRDCDTDITIEQCFILKEFFCLDNIEELFERVNKKDVKTKHKLVKP